MKKSTQIWELIYGLTIVKEGEANSLEGKHDDNDYEKEDDDMEDDDKENAIGEEIEN